MKRYVFEFLVWIILSDYQLNMVLLCFYFQCFVFLILLVFFSWQNENNDNISDDKEIDCSTALVGPICNEVDETGNSTSLVCTKSKE